jgi:ketosteroid isomerase-like protein
MVEAVEKVAERLRLAAAESPEQYTETLAELWAERVETAHEPRRDMDGPRTRDEQIAMHRGEDAAFRRAMHDYRQDDVAVSVTGDCIELSATISGTPESGDELALPVRWRFTLADGVICDVVTIVDPVHTAPVVKILHAAGIETPD